MSNQKQEPETDVFGDPVKPRTADEQMMRDMEETEKRLAGDGWPAPLIKALHDQPFNYALQLRTGAVFHFAGAEEHGEDWVMLKGVEVEYPAPVPPKERGSTLQPKHIPTFDRGVAVRLSDIVWVADAPWGS